MFRLIILLPVLGITAGCSYYWDLRQSIETGCVDSLAFYMDADDDGWGDAADFILDCHGDSESGYTAQNARDCDDTDERVTARVGSVCPVHLVAGGADYAGVTYGDSEYVAVLSGSTLVRATEAEAACGPWGWGGQLASFEDLTELTAVEGALDQFDVAPYAGFINAGWDIKTNGWMWLDGSELSFESEGWCLGITPTLEEYEPNLDPKDFDYEETVANIRISLVKRDAGWCYGSPDQSLPLGYTKKDGYDEYSLKDGHFICERTAPNPSDYSESGPEETDTALTTQ